MECLCMLISYSYSTINVAGIRNSCLYCLQLLFINNWANTREFKLKLKVDEYRLHLYIEIWDGTNDQIGKSYMEKTIRKVL